MAEVILVDKNDTPIGIYDKLKAHEEGLLHRAFSVYVFDHQGRVLLQQRALSKYHSPGLFANTCCSHQYVGEDSLVAAHRRMSEEMGFDCELEKIAELVYETPVPTNLIEHEYLHVFFGRYDNQEILPVPEEVESYKRVTIDELNHMAKSNDPTLAPWTREVFFRIEDQFNEYILK